MIVFKKNEDFMKLMNIICGLVVLSIAACSSSTPNNNLTASGLSCIASGTVTSGNASTPNSSVTLSNVSVQIIGSTGTSFSIILPNGTTVSSSTTSYTYPSTMTLITGAAGGISSLVSVSDLTNSASTSCTLSTGGTTTGTGSFTVTASPSTTATVGSTVTLTVSAPNILNPVFSFTNASTQSGVSVYGSGLTGFVSSAYANTVTVNVTLISNSSGLSQQTQSITINFGTGGTTGTNMTCYISHQIQYYSTVQRVWFYVTSATGEPLNVTYINPGFTWQNGGPTYPVSSTFAIDYSYTSYPYNVPVSVTAASQYNPASTCTANDTFYLY
jgi:hypothetical protein